MSQPTPRADERQRCMFTVEFNSVLSDDIIYSGIVFDLSEHGIGILTPRSVKVGAALVIHFRIRALARVVNVLPTRYGWRVGCKFDRPVDLALVRQVDPELN